MVLLTITLMLLLAPSYAQRDYSDISPGEAQQVLEALDRDPEKKRRVDPKSIQALEARARYISPEVARTATQVVKGVRGDKARAHAIYRFIASTIEYDVAALHTRSRPDQSPESVLRRRSAVCDGYSQLFHAMATSVGLTSHRVLGHVPARMAGGGSDFHAWNAVKISGRWHLLDATWGAGHIDPRTRKFERHTNDDWFLVNPDRFIYSHFPDESKWQLLPRPLSKSQFSKLPTLQPAFFGLGLSLLKPPPDRCSGEYRLALKCRPGTVLTARVGQPGQAPLPSTQTLVQPISASALEVRARLPQKGSYEVQVFSRKDHGLDYKAVATLSVESTSGVKTTFPLITGPFLSHGCRILKGDDGHLSSRKPTTLEIVVPGARTVKIVDSQSHFFPFQKNSKSFVWKGVLKPGEAKVQADFGNETQVLMVYQVD